MSTTSIEWTDVTWNPVRGCSLVSPGCTNCYAMKQAHRFSGKGQPYEGLTRLTAHGAVWTGKARVVPGALCQPLHWMKPRRIFVNSMSDLFHEDLTDDAIKEIFTVMASCEYLKHTFQVLTKRPNRMRDLVSRLSYLFRPPMHALFGFKGCDRGHLMMLHAWWKDELDQAIAKGEREGTLKVEASDTPNFPPVVPPNIWLGVSVENQETADERIPLLLRTPAAVRFLSVEPLLGPVDLKDFQPFRSHLYPDGSAESVCGILGGQVAWVIVGGESGPGARPCDLIWVRAIVEQCRKAKVACFVKQLGARPITTSADWYASPTRNRDAKIPYSQVDEDAGCARSGNVVLPLRHRKGAGPGEWPEDLRVREYPDAAR